MLTNITTFFEQPNLTKFLYRLLFLQLSLVHSKVNSASVHQLFMRSHFLHFTLFHHDDFVELEQVKYSVRYKDGCLLMQVPRQVIDDLFFRSVLLSPKSSPK